MSPTLSSRRAIYIFFCKRIHRSGFFSLGDAAAAGSSSSRLPLFLHFLLSHFFPFFSFYPLISSYLFVLFPIFVFYLLSFLILLHSSAFFTLFYPSFSSFTCFSTPRSSSSFFPISFSPPFLRPFSLPPYPAHFLSSLLPRPPFHLLLLLV